jgi:hypothetical protein
MNFVPKARPHRYALWGLRFEVRVHPSPRTGAGVSLQQQCSGTVAAT